MNNLTKTVESLEKSAGALDKITSMLGGISDALSKSTDFLAGMGLSGIQSNAIILLVVLVAFLGIFKFLKIVTKLLIVGVTAWVLLSIIGII